MNRKKPIRRKRKQAEAAFKTLPYPPSSSEIQKTNETRTAVATLINSDVFKLVYSVLVNERPSREIQLPSVAPYVGASLHSFSQGYEACLNKLLNLAKTPPQQTEEPMSFGLKPEQIEDL